ncbi:MAG: DUF533 domain-containing protein [Synergistaceae bacterium]|nr:DUF533 domain-containing protein [Synergistaceae bacterium]MBQ3626177.1 DUF533 domain-containing protein [Synergistaceae bacterium]MBQ4418933.1 DUF533 domain-containing protein [Synergistaceae bacterium]MBQ9582447.1 DUF533 domain-containing protein [Synergistaceae bacterium]MBR0097080.1 DUF533 domain-containing protein [Synergistaceae bacterium]
MAFNVMDLLGAVMTSGASSAGSSRAQNAAGNLEGMLGGLGSLLGGGSSSSSSPSMSGGLQGLMGTLLGGGQSVINKAGQAVGGGDNLAAAGLGALIGALSGKSGSSSMGGIGGGLMGLLGMMAFKALTGNNNNASQAQQEQLAQSIASRSQQQVASDAEIILTAMLDAAKADGQVDAEELGRITGKIKSAGIGQEGMNYLISKLQSPMETNKILAAVKGRPELAAQVYSASLMAIDVDTQAEKRYLAGLANAMGLSQSVVNNIKQIVGMQN